MSPLSHMPRMGQRNGMMKNAALLAAGNAAGSTVGLLFIAAFARAEGPEGMGFFQFAVSIGAFASLLASFGLDILLVREVAKDRSRLSALISGALACKSALALAALIVILVVAGRYDEPQSGLLIVIGAAALLDTLSSTLTSVFRGCERMEFDAAASLAGSVVAVTAGLGALAAGWDILAVAGCWSLGALAKGWAAWRITRRHFLPGGIFRLALGASDSTVAGGGVSLTRSLLSPSIACGSMAIIGAVYSNADIVMLRELASETAVGFYAAATRLNTVVLYLPSLVAASLLPALSRLSLVSDRRAAASLYGRTWEWMFLLGMPAGVGVAIVAQPLVRFIYADQFDPAAVALVWLSPYLGWFFINLVNGTAMVALGRQTFLAVGTGTAAVFDVAGNWALIPSMGVAGACLTTVVASGVGAVLYTVVCHRAFGITPRWTVLMKGALCTLTMGCAAWALVDAGVHVLVVIPAGAIVYSVLLIAAGAAPVESQAFAGAAARRVVARVLRRPAPPLMGTQSHGGE